MRKISKEVISRSDFQGTLLSGEEKKAWHERICLFFTKRNTESINEN